MISPGHYRRGRQVAGRLAGLRVLVIDDDRDGRYVLEWMLGTAGASACTAVEGTRLAETERFDVVVSDIHLQRVIDGAASQAFRIETRQGNFRMVATDLARRTEDHTSRPVLREHLVETIVQLREGRYPTLDGPVSDHG
jgi:DNA-binding NtrC family response regulator